MLPESRYARLDDLERRLAGAPDGCTTGELARAYGVSPDTIRRDLDLLASRGTALVRQGRRYRLDRRQMQHTLKLTNDELLGLYLATRQLSRHSDEHNPHVVTALDKLAELLHPTAPLVARHIALAADAVRERRVRREYLEVLHILTQGWFEGRTVRLRYRSYSKNERTERLFEPYYIESSGISYACYVIGYDQLRADLRTFKVDRILEAELTSDSYSIPDDFDPRHLLASAWGGLWRDKDDIEVRLRFAPSVARTVKASVWHHTQRIEDLPDGSCLYTVRIGSTLDVKAWIRHWGARVEVLEPLELREEMAAEVRELARLYAVARD